MKSLADSLNTLYSAFSDVPKPQRIEGCSCCISKDEVRILLSKPLREISWSELTSYAGSAFFTVGEECDYLYFLPRILEVACMDESWWLDMEIIGRAIGETKPTNWPKSRLKALVDVLGAVIQEALKEEDGWAIDTWICSIARMRLDIVPFLEQIETSPLALLSFYERNSMSLAKRKLANAFWERDIPGYDVVLAWFGSPRVSKIIADSYGFTSNDDQ